MTLKFIIILVLTLLIASCDNQTVNSSKLYLADDFNIIVNSPDTIGRDEDLYATFYISNKKYKILFAHFDCNVIDTTEVDTLRNRIIGCNNNLVLEKDTVKIWLHTGDNIGKKNFELVTLLAKDSNNKYYYQKTTFDYIVK